jgi:Tfp pilus assembly protein PilO
MKKIHIIGGVVVGVCVVLAIYLGYMFLLRPVGKDIDSGETKLKDLQNKLKTAEVKKDQHEKFRAEAENVTRNLSFVQSRMDSNFGANDVYRLFNSLFVANNIVNYSIKSGKTKRVTDMMEFPVEISFAASYNQTGELINSVLRQRRIAIPTTTKLWSLQPQDQGASSMSGTLGFSVFAQVGAGAPAAPAKKVKKGGRKKKKGGH